MKIIVTGGAGFIGAHLCRRLLSRGDEVVAIDNFDPFYDPTFKRRSVDELRASEGFRLVEADLLDPAATPSSTSPRARGCGRRSTTPSSTPA